MERVLPDDVDYLRTLIANVVLIGEPDSREWVLVDAGVATFADNITDFAKQRHGSAPPRAIVLTHGHFDHVGSLRELLEAWPNVPVYAHEAELPYLTGRADYPEADPEVGGGLMARLSLLYPHKGIDLGDRVRALPEEGAVPGLPGWRWIHAPGHTKGQVALFREADRTLVAGDAFITVKQESAFAVLTQEKDIHGPPAYFTFDWDDAWESVRRLAALDPQAAVTGHGVPMGGDELKRGLGRLAEQFDRLAIPDNVSAKARTRP